MATTVVKSDRLTLSTLTADPSSVVAGDLWFRSDFGKTKQAIDSVVANARLLRREGDIIPAAEIEDLDTAKINTGRFGMAGMPDGTSGRVLTAQGVGVNPLYSELSTTTVTDFQATDTLRNSNDTGRTTTSYTYVKLKETKLGANLAAIRIRFDLRGDRVQDWEGFCYNTTGTFRLKELGDRMRWRVVPNLLGYLAVGVVAVIGQPWKALVSVVWGAVLLTLGGAILQNLKELVLKLPDFLGSGQNKW